MLLEEANSWSAAEGTRYFWSAAEGTRYFWSAVKGTRYFWSAVEGTRYFWSAVEGTKYFWSAVEGTKYFELGDWPSPPTFVDHNCYEASHSSRYEAHFGAICGASVLIFASAFSASGQPANYGQWAVCFSYMSMGERDCQLLRSWGRKEWQKCDIESWETENRNCRECEYFKFLKNTLQNSFLVCIWVNIISIWFV